MKVNLDDKIPNIWKHKPVMFQSRPTSLLITTKTSTKFIHHTIINHIKSSHVPGVTTNQMISTAVSPLPTDGLLHLPPAADFEDPIGSAIPRSPLRPSGVPSSPRETIDFPMKIMGFSCKFSLKHP